jgi:hypothetical protein
MLNFTSTSENLIFGIIRGRECSIVEFAGKFGEVNAPYFSFSMPLSDISVLQILMVREEIDT